MSVDLSIVIPVYNEEHRISRTLSELAAFCSAYVGTTEVIIVDDGSKDRTVELISSFVPQLPSLRCLVNERNQGKGAVVRQGMLEATGTQILMTDADLSSPLSELPKLQDAMAGGYDIVIGSRAMAESEIVVRQPRFRELFGKTFNLLVRLLYLPALKDTQCGFKLFSLASAQAVFSRQRIHGMVFDVEVLYVARKLGLRIREIPVVWENSPETRFHATLSNAWQVIRDLLSIGWVHRRDGR